MVTSEKAQTVGSGGWAAAVGSRGLGQSVIFGLLALSVISGALAVPNAYDGSAYNGAQQASRRSGEDLGVARRDNNAGVVHAVVRSQGERPGNVNGNFLEARAYHHGDAAPLARRHHSRNSNTRRGSILASIMGRPVEERKSAESESDAKDDDDERNGNEDNHGKKAASKISDKTFSSANRRPSKTSTTKASITSTKTSSSKTTSRPLPTSSAPRAPIYKVLVSAKPSSSTASTTPYYVASSTSEPVPSSSAPESWSSDVEHLSSTGTTVNRVAAAAAAAATTTSVFNVHNKLFPAVIVILVCGVLALLFLAFLGLRAYRWRKEDKAKQVDSSRLTGAGTLAGYDDSSRRSRGSMIKSRARSLRGALSSNRFGRENSADAPPQGTVLLQIGNEVLCVPSSVAQEYQAAKRMYGGTSDMWNGRLYLSQCLARHERHEQGVIHPSPLSNIASWNKSSSTLASDSYLDEEKRREEKRGLSSRLLENLRAMRGINGADETDESIDPEKTAALNDHMPIVTQGAQQWGIAPSRPSTQTDLRDEPARRSSETPYAHGTPQMVASPTPYDSFNDFQKSPLPRQMSVVIRQRPESRCFSPRLIPLPASPMPESNEARSALPPGTPKVTLEDKPSPEARTRIVSRRIRHRSSAVPDMPSEAADDVPRCAADAYQTPDLPVATLTTPNRTPPVRAMSCAVTTQPQLITGRQRGHRSTSVPGPTYETSPKPSGLRFALGPTPTTENTLQSSSSPQISPSKQMSPPSLSSTDATTPMPPQDHDITPTTSRSASPESRTGLTQQRAVSVDMSPMSSRERLHSARANLHQERQRRISYSGPNLRTAVKSSRYVSGPAAPVWSRHQSLD